MHTRLFYVQRMKQHHDVQLPALPRLALRAGIEVREHTRLENAHEALTMTQESASRRSASCPHCRGRQRVGFGIRLLKSTQLSANALSTMGPLFSAQLCSPLYCDENEQ